MRYFVAEKMPDQASYVRLNPEDSRHVTKVLRLGKGDPIGLVDGQGQAFDGLIQETSQGCVIARIVGEKQTLGESPLGITVCQGYLKDKKMDALVRALTELGMTTWQPFFAQRSVARPADGKILQRKNRWEKIAREALKQCRRSVLPQIETPIDFSQALAKTAGADCKLIFWEEAKTEPLVIPAKPVRQACIILGPEGGLTPQEVAIALEAGFEVNSLGPRILRAETAALTACAIVQHRLGDLSVRP